MINPKIVRIGTPEKLLLKKLIYRGDIFQVSGRSEACKEFKISDKVRLVKITAIVSDGGKRLIVFGNKLQAELKPDYLIK